jgi:hypothetical protein
MKRLTLIALLTLTLAPALQAQGYRHDDRRDDRRYDDRHSVFPEARRLGRVAAIAHEIDAQATYIRREFERNNRRPDQAEARAIGTLNQLNAAAARFHDEVDRSRNPRRSADEFANLERAFNTTERSLRRINRRPYVDQGMNRIYTLMNELGGYYGHQSGYYGTWGRDRDWSHDNDRDRNNGDHDRNNGDHDRNDRDHDNGYRPPHRR